MTGPRPDPAEFLKVVLFGLVTLRSSRAYETNGLRPPPWLDDAIDGFAEAIRLLQADPNGQERPNDAESTASTETVGGDDGRAVLLRPTEAAEMLRVSTRSLRRYTSTGAIKAIRVGRSVRYDPEELRKQR